MAVTITDAGYKEYQELKADKKRITDDLMERFRMKSVCSHCGVQSMDVYPDQGVMCDGTWCEGSMVAMEDK